MTHGADDPLSHSFKGRAGGEVDGGNVVGGVRRGFSISSPPPEGFETGGESGGGRVQLGGKGQGVSRLAFLSRPHVATNCRARSGIWRAKGMRGVEGSDDCVRGRGEGERGDVAG